MIATVAEFASHKKQETERSVPLVPGLLLRSMFFWLEVQWTMVLDSGSLGFFRVGEDVS